ncbi:class I SAM-dependent methyltransferase [uncultured Gimesia sp.]|uniref:class I SAM-dependent methyltransferase n=1 Tax=uncultured Gimesia sp. TaxID=1678688 RepID=UPI002601E4D1|nr:class I SAM-dependent methyltransferase [uncultured Gimesia sp.]
MVPDSFNICPLCQISGGAHFYEDDRTYFRCPSCQLVYVPPEQFLTSQAEKAVYDQHQNSPDDPGYRRFLGRLFEPMSQRLPLNSRGLDFGSGPGPTLSVMFEEAGHRMEIYDPFYAPDTKSLEHQYDFITATEVLEHLHHPRSELDQLWSCLKPNGSLGIMTKRVIDRKAFSTWHYKNDPTHVCFYSVETFQWLANYWCATFTIPENDVVVFTKGHTDDSH